MMDRDNHFLMHGDLVKIVNVDHHDFYRAAGFYPRGTFKVIGSDTTGGTAKAVVEVPGTTKCAWIPTKWLVRCQQDREVSEMTFDEMMAHFMSKRA